MEVRDEVVCVAASPTAPIIAFATVPSTRNEAVDERIMQSNIKVSGDTPAMKA